MKPMLERGLVQIGMNGRPSKATQLMNVATSTMRVPRHVTVSDRHDQKHNYIAYKNRPLRRLTRDGQCNTEGQFFLLHT